MREKEKIYKNIEAGSVSVTEIYGGAIMTADLRTFDADQLLTACACMESACIAFINRCSRDGYDTTELKAILDEVHAAIDGLSDE